MNDRHVNLFLLCVLSVSVLPQVCNASEGVSVGQWARFERTVDNTRMYRNPYTDVKLDVTYKSPDGKRRRFWGFYDGARTWKIRFMPKPLYAQEVFWPGNKYHKIRYADDIRKKAFVLMMSAAAINLADMDGDSSTGFSGSMDLSDRNQVNHDIVREESLGAEQR